MFGGPESWHGLVAGGDLPWPGNAFGGPCPELRRNLLLG